MVKGNGSKHATTAVYLQPCWRRMLMSVALKTKKAARLPWLPFGWEVKNYFLPKRLRNFSTRPPMLSTDF